GELDQLSLAVRELTDEAMANCSDADPRHGLVGPPLGSAAWGHLGGRDPHVVPGAKPIEHVRHLRLDAHTHAGDGMAAIAGDRRVAEQNFALARPELPGEALEEGALARAVGADYAAQLALLQREVDVVDSDHAAEAHGESARLQERCARHGSVRSEAVAVSVGVRLANPVSQPQASVARPV